MPPAERRTGLRIGIDATALVAEPTGVGNYILPILTSMARGHPDSTFMLYSNHEVQHPPAANLVPRVLAGGRRGPWWQNTHLAAMLRQDRLDVHWAANGLVPARRPRDLPVVVTIHDLVYRFARDTLPLHSYVGRALFQPLAVRVARRVVAVSAATAADLERVCGRRPDVVLHPLAGPGFRLAARDDVARVRGTYGLFGPYLLTTGTVEPRKNLITLLRAYERCRAGEVPLPRLAIAGRSGWKNGPIEQALAEAQSRGWLHRLGYVPSQDLPGLYAGADAFVLPSRYEGFGMPLVEAQLCGTPVLHGDHPAMREAAGGLGIALRLDVDGMAADLADYAHGVSAVACRLPGDIDCDVDAHAEVMWDLFEQAAASVARGPVSG